MDDINAGVTSCRALHELFRCCVAKCHAMPELPTEKQSHACFFHSTPLSIPACVSSLLASHTKHTSWVLWRH